MTASRRIAPDPSAMLDSRTVAERLAVSTRTVREMRFDGRLQPDTWVGYRSPRYRAATVERFIRDNSRRQR